MGLTLVPTPLGNLRDITLRALDVLRDCDLVVAEDTRVARKLLAALDLPSKPLLSYREQNAAKVTETVLERANEGEVALVCDAGMPAISDPGRDLVVTARARGIPVTVLPGAVAFICAAVLSGFDLNGMAFRGFVPRTAGARRSALEAALSADGPTAWYESPHRIVATLEALNALDPQARVFVGRELTKLHEQQILGTAAAVIEALEEPVRGEVVLVVEPRARAPEPAEPDEVDAAIDALLATGMRPAAVAKAMAERMGGQRSAAYARVVARSARGDSRR